MKHTITPAEIIMKLLPIQSLAKLCALFTAFMLIYSLTNSSSTDANLLTPFWSELT